MNDETTADEVARILGNNIRTEAEEINRQCCILAELGVGLCLCKAIAGEGKSRACVVLVSGPIPDDLLAGLRKYVEGLAQDVQMGLKARQVPPEKPSPADETH